MSRSGTFLLCLGLNVLLYWDSTWTLTGHVCRRQKEETYRVSTNKAFLCSERYTTSCGHLDWRRCTRYRVQTCYTPSERYAKRYREVEECCPGWIEAAGSCNIPACHGLCQNGGVCSDTGAVPHCSCLPGFYGDSCQFRQNKPIDTPPSGPSSSSSSSSPSEASGVPAWIVPVVVATSVLGVAVVGVFGFWLFRRSMSTSSPRISPMTVSATGTSASFLPQSGSLSTRSGMSPSAPSYEESTAAIPR